MISKQNYSAVHRFANKFIDSVFECEKKRKEKGVGAVLRDVEQKQYNGRQHRQRQKKNMPTIGQ